MRERGKTEIETEDGHNKNSKVESWEEGQSVEMKHFSTNISAQTAESQQTTKSRERRETLERERERGRERERETLIDRDLKRGR